MSDWIFNFDEEVQEDGTLKTVNDFEQRVFTDFGEFQLAAYRNVTLYQAGAVLEVPEIKMPDGSNFSRKGIKEGGKVRMFFVTRLSERQDGTPFKEVRMFTDNVGLKVDKEIVEGYPETVKLSPRQLKRLEDKGETYISDWSNLQAEVMRQLPEPYRTKFGQGQPVFARADNHNTGRAPNVVTKDDGTEKKYYDRFWHNFTFYETKEEMKEAAEKYFAELNDDTPSVAFPADWAGYEEDMLKHGQELAAKGEKPADIAKALNLNNALDKDGKTVDVRGILAVILDVPPPMVQL